MFNYFKSIISYLLKYLLDKSMLQGPVQALYGLLCNSIQTQIFVFLYKHKTNDAVGPQHIKSSSSPFVPGVGKEN